MKKIARLFESKINKLSPDKILDLYKDTQYSDVLFFIVNELESLKKNPITTLIDELGSIKSQKALKILRFAADELNYSKAQVLLGAWHLTGENELEVNRSEAIKYYKMAALENEVAMASLESLAREECVLAQQALEDLGHLFADTSNRK